MKSHVREIFSAGVALVLLLFVISCHSSNTMLTTRALSPDGKMIATERYLSNGGFGADGQSSAVSYLNWATGAQKPTEIASSYRVSSMSKPEIKFEWTDNNHLKIICIHKNQEFDFLAVKFVYVQISTLGCS